jgi:hypothetical protein
MSSLTDIDDESVAGVGCLSAINASTAQHERSETLRERAGHMRALALTMKDPEARRRPSELRGADGFSVDFLWARASRLLWLRLVCGFSRFATFRRSIGIGTE